MALRLSRTSTVGLAAIAAFIAFLPLPARISANFVLEPGQMADVRATVPGIVRQVLVRQDDEVRRGQVLAVLENPQIATDAAVDAEQLSMAQSRLRAAEASADSSAAANAAGEAAKFEEALKEVRQKLDQLTIRAPMDGTIATPELGQTVGSDFAEGQAFCHIAARRGMRARILVRDWEIQDVAPGANIALKIAPYPWRTYSARVERILPAAAIDQPVSDPIRLTRYGQDLTNYIAIIADFPNSDGSLREGMTGIAKVSGPARPLGWQWGRDGWRWLRSQVW